MLLKVTSILVKELEKAFLCTYTLESKRQVFRNFQVRERDDASTFAGHGFHPEQPQDRSLGRVRPQIRTSGAAEVRQRPRRLDPRRHGRRMGGC